jgi:hypothetical protein
LKGATNKMASRVFSAIRGSEDRRYSDSIIEL